MVNLAQQDLNKGLTGAGRGEDMGGEDFRRPNFMLPQRAIDVVVERLSEGATIVEMGSGDGTLALLQRGFNVVSVEHDPDWASIHPGTCILTSIEPCASSEAHGEAGWYVLDENDNRFPPKFELLLVDGPPGWIGRSGLLGHEWLINRATNILIDDTDRMAEEQLAAQVQSMTNGSIEHIHADELNGRGLPRTFSWITCSEVKL